MEVGMLLVKAIVLGMVVTAVLGFFFIKVLSKTTEGAVSRLNRETEAVRDKQKELNVKIKEANDELTKRRAEADALVAKMTEEASEKAKEEREKIVNKARADGEEIINKAQKTKDEIRKVLEKEMEMKAVDFTEIILAEIFTEKANKAFNDCLIDDFLADLKTVAMDIVKDEVDTAEVVTSMPFDERHKTELVKIAKDKLGREIKVDAKVDKSIISGILLRFGNLSLDRSLMTLVKDKGFEIKEMVEKGLLKKEQEKKAAEKSAEKGA